MPSTLEIANQLCTLVKAHKFPEAITTLFSDDMTSVEAVAMPGHGRELKGKPAILGKNQWWVENHDIHSMEVDGPYPHDDRFIVNYAIDVTAKAGPMAGQRFSMKEAALYTIKDGKIVKEEFFYSRG